MDPSVADFLGWEARSRDTIDVKRCYIDVAGGDLEAGVMLSQILYFFLLDREGLHHRNLVWIDGEQWIPISREQWWQECRLSPRQADRCIRQLSKRGVLITGARTINGRKTSVFRLDWPTFLRLLRLAITTPSKSPNGDLLRSTRRRVSHRTVRSTSPFGHLPLTKRGVVNHQTVICTSIWERGSRKREEEEQKRPPSVPTGTSLGDSGTEREGEVLKGGEDKCPAADCRAPQASEVPGAPPVAAAAPANKPPVSNQPTNQPAHGGGGVTPDGKPTAGGGDRTPDPLSEEDRRLLALYAENVG